MTSKQIMETVEVDTGAIDQVLKNFSDKPGQLLGVLESVQALNPHKYLSSETLKYVAEQLHIPLSRVYSVVTFYSFFNLKPQGDHCIVVCRGTACHTRRSKEIFNTIKDVLKLKENPAEAGEKIFLTTDDMKFTLKTVACFGQCALAPVVEIDGVIHSRVNNETVRELIAQIQQKEAQK